MSPTPSERTDRLEQQAAEERVARVASDVEHSTRIDALEKKVDDGFRDTRQDFTATRADISDLRKLVVRLVWIVGSLWSLIHYGPGVAKGMEDALTPLPSPVPIVRALDASPAPSTSPAPSLVDARP